MPDFIVVPVEYRHLTAQECEELKLRVAEELILHSRRRRWGTYGPEGKGPLVYKPIEELDTQHLENILITQPDLKPDMRAALLALLKQRYLSEYMGLT